VTPCVTEDRGRCKKLCKKNKLLILANQNGLQKKRKSQLLPKKVKNKNNQKYNKIKRYQWASFIHKNV